tara:strand:+ start:3557 stop:3763 length:207 start_codon:yes stop_codon:yes gene_type:complete
MGILGAQEIVILVIMISIMFGAKKIPELARNAGRAKGEFQRGLKEGMSLAGEDMDRGGMTKEHLEESE